MGTEVRLFDTNVGTGVSRTIENIKFQSKGRDSTQLDSCMVPILEQNRPAKSRYFLDDYLC